MTEQTNQPQPPVDNPNASAETVTVSKADYDRLNNELQQRNSQLNDVISKNNQLIGMLDKPPANQPADDDDEFLKELFGEPIANADGTSTPPPVNQTAIKKLYEETSRKEAELARKTEELNKRTMELSRQQELSELTTQYPNLGNIRQELAPLIQQYPDVSPKVLMHLMLGQKVLENPDLHTYIVDPKQLTETKSQLELLRKQVPPKPQQNGIHIVELPAQSSNANKPFSMRSAVSQVVQDLYNKGV